jgi:hypothetical protein
LPRRPLAKAFGVAKAKAGSLVVSSPWSLKLLFVYDLDLPVDYLPGKPVYSPRAPSNVAPLRQRNDSHQAPHWINGWVMGVSEILEEIKSLPMQQRWEILERTREMLGEEIPESFKQGMREIARGEVIELDEALEELEQPQ